MLCAVGLPSLSTVGDLEKRLAAAESALDTSLGVGSGSVRQGEDEGGTETPSQASVGTRNGASTGAGAAAAAASEAAPARASAFTASAPAGRDTHEQQAESHGRREGQPPNGSGPGHDASDTDLTQQLEAERRRSARYADRVQRCERRVAQLESLIRSIASGKLKLPDAAIAGSAAPDSAAGPARATTGTAQRGDDGGEAETNTAQAGTLPTTVVGGTQGAGGSSQRVGAVHVTAAVQVPCSHCAELQAQVWRLQQVRPAVVAQHMSHATRPLLTPWRLTSQDVSILRSREASGAAATVRANVRLCLRLDVFSPRLHATMLWQAAAAAHGQVAKQPMLSMQSRGGQARVHRGYHHYRHYSRHRSSGNREGSWSRSRSRSRGRHHSTRHTRSRSRKRRGPNAKEEHSHSDEAPQAHQARGVSKDQAPKVNRAREPQAHSGWPGGSAPRPGEARRAPGAPAAPDCSVCGSPCPPPRSSLVGVGGNGTDRVAHGSAAHGDSVPAGMQHAVPMAWFDVDGGVRRAKGSQAAQHGNGVGVPDVEQNARRQPKSSFGGDVVAASDDAWSEDTDAAWQVDLDLDVPGETQLRWADLERIGPATQSAHVQTRDPPCGGSGDEDGDRIGGDVGEAAASRTRRRSKHSRGEDAQRHERRRRRVAHARRLARELHARIESQERRLQCVLAAASPGRAARANLFAHASTPRPAAELVP